MAGRSAVTHEEGGGPSSADHNPRDDESEPASRRVGHGGVRKKRKGRLAERWRAVRIGETLRFSLNLLSVRVASTMLDFPHARRPVCHCLGVTEDEIRTAIEAEGLATVRQVAQSCGAGSGCTACHRHIKRYLQEMAHRRSAVTKPHSLPQPEPAFGYA